MMIFVVILAVAAGLRAWKLGQLNFWYDEVVTMRLATAPTLAALFDRLFQIDATRAPLHPLLLQALDRAVRLDRSRGPVSERGVRARHRRPVLLDRSTGF